MWASAFFVFLLLWLFIPLLLALINKRSHSILKTDHRWGFVIGIISAAIVLLYDRIHSAICDLVRETLN